jgi:flagellar biogenesis protein FliO
MERILKNDKPDKADKAAKQDPKKLTAGKNPPSIWKSFFWTTILIAGFFILALAVRKLRGKGLEKRLMGEKGITKFIGTLTAGRFGKKGKMIEIIANHHLGPKKSIAVVRIKDRMLVVGITNEAINLISEMSPDGDLESVAEESSFSNELVKMGAGAQAAGKTTFSGGVRDQIKKRVEGLKDL